MRKYEVPGRMLLMADSVTEFSFWFLSPYCPTDDEVLFSPCFSSDVFGDNKFIRYTDFHNIKPFFIFKSVNALF